MTRRVVAVDLGATSGRVMVARVGVDPDVLELEEVHRFPNGAVRDQHGSLRWDISRIRREVLAGIKLAAESGPVDGIGIDSWAIDYGLIDADGELLGDPFSHRDSRTDGVAERVVAKIGEEALYDETGLQRLPFNTLYQLVAAHENEQGADELHRATTMLLIPDLLGFWLTGKVGGRAHQCIHDPVLRRPLARVVEGPARSAGPSSRHPAPPAQSGRRRRDPAARGGRRARTRSQHPGDRGGLARHRLGSGGRAGR